MSSFGIRLTPRASESAIKKMVEAAGGVYEAPKKGKLRSDPEHSFHCSVRDLLRALIGEPAVRNSLGVTWRSFDQGQKRAKKNETTGKAYNIEGQKAHARGVRAGVSDVRVRWVGGQAWMELKANYNQADDNQKQFHRVEASYGDHVGVFWDRHGVEPIEIFLRKAGCPLKGSIGA